jgi:hypothetical protein
MRRRVLCRAFSSAGLIRVIVTIFAIFTVISVIAAAPVFAVIPVVAVAGVSVLFFLVVKAPPGA